MCIENHLSSNWRHGKCSANKPRESEAKGESGKEISAL